MISILQAKKLGRLSGSWIAPNITAGLVVAAVALPLSLAYAIASGMPPQVGIYTTMIMTFLGSLFGGSMLLISGPAPALITILAGISATDGPDAVVLTALIAGVILLIMGLVKFGLVMRFIPEPVVLGFVVGVAFIVAMSAFPYFTGVPKPHGLANHEKLIELGQHISEVYWPTVIMGISALLIMILFQTVKPLKRIPGPLVVLVLGIIVMKTLQPEGVATIGTQFKGIPQGLPTFTLPEVSFSRVIGLIVPGFTVAFVASLETLLAAKVGDGLSGTKHLPDQELKSQGIANIVCSLFGAMPGAGSVSRTATSLKSGGSSPIAGITLAVTLAIILLLLAPQAADVPMAVIGAILMMVAWKMAEFPHLISTTRHAPRTDVVILWLTAILTVFAGLQYATPVGVMIAALYFMKRMASEVSYSTREGGAADDDLTPLDLPAGTLLLDIDGPFFFAAIEPFEIELGELGSDPKNLIIRLDDAPYMDFSGLEALEDAITHLHKRGVRVIVSDANVTVRKKLEAVGIVKLIGAENMVPSFEDALALVRQG